MRLFDSELKVLEVLWEKGPQTAARIAAELKETVGWSRNTTYTVIQKCIKKGAIRREEPKFLCIPLITRESVQSSETEELIGRMYAGSRQRFFAALLADERLGDAELRELQEMIEKRRRK